jgi:hypothetical protein
MRCHNKLFAAALTLSATLGGCYTGGDVCTVDQVNACVGANGCAGEKVCQDDGTPGECVCEAPPEPGGSSSGTTGGSTGSTGSLAAPGSTGDDGGSSTGASGSAGSTTGDESTGEPQGSDGSTGASECPCGANQDCVNGTCQACETVVSIKNERQDKLGECDVYSMMQLIDGTGVAHHVASQKSFEFTAKFGEMPIFKLSCCEYKEVSTKCTPPDEDQACWFEDIPVECLCEVPTDFPVDVMKCGEQAVIGCGN